MSTATHYEETELSLFAMQLLDREAHQVVAAHVKECLFCRQELARLQGDLAACAYGIEMYSPAAVVRERVMHQVAREKKAPPVEPVERRAQIEAVARDEEPEEPRLEFRTRSASRQTASRGEHNRRREDRQQREPSRPLFRGPFLWLGWAAAAGLAVGGANLYYERENYRSRLATQAGEVDQLREDAAGSRRLLETITDPSAQQILLSSTADATTDGAPEGHVIYAADKGALVLLADNLSPLQPDKVYELWLIPADERDPIPAGTFHPDARGHGSIVLPPLPKAVQAKTFGVTVEDGAGAQSPTMPIVLAGS